MAVMEENQIRRVPVVDASGLLLRHHLAGRRRAVRDREPGRRAGPRSVEGHARRDALGPTAFSPIITHAALVVALTTSGMIDPSATRRPVDAAHAQRRIDHCRRVGRRSHLAGAGAVIDRVAVAARERGEVGVALHRRSRQNFVRPQIRIRIGFAEPARQLHAAHERVDVRLFLQIVGANDRRRQRIGRSQRDFAAGFRKHQRHGDGDESIRRLDAAADVELQVGRVAVVRRDSIA